MRNCKGFHWIWRPMLNAGRLHMTAIPRNGSVSSDISLIRLHFVVLLPCVTLQVITLLCNHDVCVCGVFTLHWFDWIKMFWTKVCVGCVHTVSLGPRDQPASGIAWLHLRIGWNNPPNPISSWFVPPLLTAGCRNSAHVMAASGWTTRKWRVPVINTRQQEQDVQITKEHELSYFFFFLSCYCLKLTCCFLSWCHFPRGMRVLRL